MPKGTWWALKTTSLPILLFTAAGVSVALAVRRRLAAPASRVAAASAVQEPSPPVLPYHHHRRAAVTLQNATVARRGERMGMFDDPDHAADALDDQSSSESRLDRIRRRQRRHAFDLLAMCAVGLVPWTVLLATTLPQEYHVHHWQITWVGFDVLLIAAIATTAILGWRRRLSVVVSALLTATLLVCDAWFDVSLDLGTGDVWLAVALAVFVELPVAGFLIHRVHALISSMGPLNPGIDGRVEPGSVGGQIAWAPYCSDRHTSASRTPSRCFGWRITESARQVTVPASNDGPDAARITAAI
jgi:hypothetical protein